MTGSWSVCPACGCVVADVLAHADWHDRAAARAELGGVSATPVTGAAWPAGVPVTLPHPVDAGTRARALAERAAVDVLTALSESAHTDGEEWRAPSGAHDAYPLDATVNHDGRTYRSLIAFNATQPGNPADPQSWRWWDDIAPEPEPPTGPAPWDGNGHAYEVGVEVTYLGVTYRVRQAHTSLPTWTPNLVPALYLPI